MLAVAVQFYFMHVENIWLKYLTLWVLENRACKVIFERSTECTPLFLSYTSRSAVSMALWHMKYLNLYAKWCCVLCFFDIRKSQQCGNRIYECRDPTALNDTRIFGEATATPAPFRCVTSGLTALLSWIYLGIILGEFDNRVRWE